MTECWSFLLSRHKRLWDSQPHERSVMFVSLLEGVDSFMLDLTLRYAGLQSRKPDEVVFLSSGILQEPQKQTLLPLDPEGALGAAEVELSGSPGSGSVRVVDLAGRNLSVSLPDFLVSLRDKAGAVMRLRSTPTGPARSLVLSVLSCGDGPCSVRPLLSHAFNRELEPRTALVFVSAERLLNERLIEENVACLSACEPKCSQQIWCGQTSTRADGALYDLSIRRSAGYRNHVA